MSIRTRIFSLVAILLSIVFSRSYGFSTLHLPDTTLVVLIIAGIYCRGFIAPFAIIVTAVMVDNYAIFSQGVSANCITPAYSILPVLYYGVYWFAKFIPSLAIDSVQIFTKTSAIIVAIISLEWLLATSSYYAFTQALWADFPAYALKWSLVEIPGPLYQLVLAMLVITFASKLMKKTHKTHVQG